MLEFLNGYYAHVEGQEGTVVGFNEDTRKLIVKTENKKKVEVNLFESGLIFDIDCYEDWKQKIYCNLISGNGKNSTTLHVFSTINTDAWDWNFHINRNENNFKDNDNDTIEIINYSITFCGEIVGDILSIQEDYNDVDGQKEERKFNRWIEQQIEEVNLFNHSEYIKDAKPSIIIMAEDFEDVFYDEFVGLMFDMWEEHEDNL